MSEDLIFTDDNTVCIDNTHTIFEDTKFSKHKWKICGTPLDGEERQAIIKKHTKIKKGGREITDDQKVQSETFNRQVERWEGISIQKKNDPNPIVIECNTGNKAWLAKKWFGFTQLVNIAFLNRQVEDEEGKKEEAKNLESSGSGN